MTLLKSYLFELYIKILESFEWEILILYKIRALMWGEFHLVIRRKEFQQSSDPGTQFNIN